MRYFFRVEYNGAAYGGWQKQPGTPTIQQNLDDAFATVLREPIRTTGAGRTDAGVHARGQAAHFDAVNTFDIRRTETGVNAVLPPDIAIYDLQEVADGFHARFHPLWRRYVYTISVRKSPLHHGLAWMLYHPVCWEKIRDSIPDLFGRHDFSTFCASGSATDDMICEITDTRLVQLEHGYAFSITANRFVYTMVRSIVGTLVDIGAGRIASPLSDILASRDRLRSGSTAPAWGLSLDWVTYELDNNGSPIPSTCKREDFRGTQEP